MAQRVGRGIALLFHDHGTRRGWVVSSTPRPYFTAGKNSAPIVQEARWAPGPVWTGGKSHSTGIRSPVRPSCSQSLYLITLYESFKPFWDRCKIQLYVHKQFQACNVFLCLLSWLGNRTLIIPCCSMPTFTWGRYWWTKLELYFHWLVAVITWGNRNSYNFVVDHTVFVE